MNAVKTTIILAFLTICLTTSSFSDTKTFNPFSGISISSSTGKGVSVFTTKSNTPARQAGLVKGDIIQSINGEDVKTIDEWRAVTKKIRESQTQKVRIKYTRNGKSNTATLTPVTIKPGETNRSEETTLALPDKPLGVSYDQAMNGLPSAFNMKRRGPVGGHSRDTSDIIDRGVLLAITYDTKVDIIGASMLMRVVPAGDDLVELFSIVAQLLINTVPEYDWGEAGRLWFGQSYTELHLFEQHDKRVLIVGHKRITMLWLPQFDSWYVIITHKDNNESTGF